MWPVMNEASSDAMKTIALASSSERPRRPIGTPVTRAALFSGVLVKRVNMPVSVGPGATPFTRIPDLAISSHRLGDAFDGVLAADIDRGPRRTLVPVGRGDVDNATAALSLHDAHFVLHAQDHAENIRVERRSIAFRGLVRDRANLAFGAGIVHRDIETAKPCDGLVDQSADVILLADVSVDELGLRTERAQLLNERLAGLFTPTGNDHLRALLGEGDGGATDAGQGASDQHYWVAHLLILAICCPTGRVWRALFSREQKLALKDGALGFWQAVEEVWPRTRGQRCWVHKTVNVLNKLPKSQQSKAKRALQEIWMAETKKDALAAFDAFIETWGVKYDKAVECLIKDRDALLAFYDFPAEHWKHLRTTNPIESSFATVRHR